MIWTDVYEEFIAIADECFPNEEEVENRIEKFYSEHKGEPVWDEAWRRWNEDVE